MITFNDLLTDPIYREMSERELFKVLVSEDVTIETVKKIEYNFGITNGSSSTSLFNHLQKLKAESEAKVEPIYGKSPILDHINAIESQKYIDRIAEAIRAKMNKDIDKATEDIHKPYNPKLTGICTMADGSAVDINGEHPIQITDQKAREICAKYFNCPPNELKILHH